MSLRTFHTLGRVEGEVKVKKGILSRVQREKEVRRISSRFDDISPKGGQGSDEEKGILHVI